MMRNKNVYLGLTTGLLAAAGWLLMQPSLQSRVNAQQRQVQNGQQEQQQISSNTLQLPVQQQVLELKVKHPDETRVGQSFRYEVEVTNVSDQIMLHDVKLTQTLSSQLEIEDVNTDSKGSQSGSQQGQASSSGQNQNQAAQNDQNPANQSNSGQQNAQREQQQEIQSETSNGKQTWTISRLKPGESKTIQVTAASDKEGEVQTCLAVSSYTPSLCLKTNFVKPELEIVKRAPGEANLCDQLEFEYLVKNTGSGDLQRFEIQDELPEGIQTASGDKSLKFAVDGLKAGETRKFVAEVRAIQAGEFSSRAVALMQNGEKTRSQKQTTKIKEGDLAVAIDGPQTHYVDRPLTFNIRVTNTGDAPAPNTQLDFRYAEPLSVASVGEPRRSDQAVQASAGNEGEAVHKSAYRPEQSPQGEQQNQQKDDAGQSSKSGTNQQQQNDAGQQKQSDSDQQDQTNSNQQNQDRSNQQEQGQDQQEQGQNQNRETHSWDLGTLEPGETRKVTVTMRPHEGGQFAQQALARFVCGKGTDHEVTQTAQASLQTEVLSLPALLIGVSDSKDPVAVDQETVYDIVVKNEGTAADKNIRVSVELPEELKFVEASGETQPSEQGQTVTFEPVQELQPGESISWKIRTQATAEGTTRLKVRLQSESYSREVTAEEPTRLYEGSAPDSQGADDQSSGESDSGNSSKQSGSENSGSDSQESQKEKPQNE